MTVSKNNIRKEILHNLKTIGFSEREARIYLFLTEKLETTPYIISQALSIPRATVYQNLETMRKQGVVIASRKNGTLHYSPESFTKLKDIMETKQKALHAVLPQLQTLVSTSTLHEPSSHVYLGTEATKQVWEDMLESYRIQKITHTYVTSSIRIYESYGNYFTNWIERRKNISHLTTHLIFPESERNNPSLTGPFKNEQFKFLPDEFLYPGEITVYGNKTAVFFFDKDEPYAIVLQSPEIADIFTRTLKILWLTAKE